MLETLLVGAIVLGAAIWFARWLRGTAGGSDGCSCGGCDKKCAWRKDKRKEEA